MLTRKIGTGAAVAALCLMSACATAVAEPAELAADAAAGSATGPESGPGVVCATQELKEAVAGFYAGNPATPTLIVSRILGVSEELVVSALSEDLASGTTGAH